MGCAFYTLSMPTNGLSEGSGNPEPSQALAVYDGISILEIDSVLKKKGLTRARWPGSPLVPQPGTKFFMASGGVPTCLRYFRSRVQEFEISQNLSPRDLRTMQESPHKDDLISPAFQAYLNTTNFMIDETRALRIPDDMSKESFQEWSSVLDGRSDTAIANLFGSYPTLDDFLPEEIDRTRGVFFVFFIDDQKRSRMVEIHYDDGQIMVYHQFPVEENNPYLHSDKAIFSPEFQKIQRSWTQFVQQGIEYLGKGFYGLYAALVGAQEEKPKPPQSKDPNPYRSPKE